MIKLHTNRGCPLIGLKLSILEAITPRLGRWIHFGITHWPMDPAHLAALSPETGERLTLDWTAQ